MSDPKEIYLELICPKCGDQGGERQWCSDDVWAGDFCDGCGGEIEAIKYQRVPEGFVIVPREPTEKMTHLGEPNAEDTCNEFHGMILRACGCPECDKSSHEAFRAIWQAMIDQTQMEKT